MARVWPYSFVVELTVAYLWLCPNYENVGGTYCSFCFPVWARCLDNFFSKALQHVEQPGAEQQIAWLTFENNLILFVRVMFLFDFVILQRQPNSWPGQNTLNTHIYSVILLWNSFKFYSWYVGHMRGAQTIQYDKCICQWKWMRAQAFVCVCVCVCACVRACVCYRG